MALAVIVLALWTTDAAVSANPLCARARARLFDLSVEELMDIPISFVDADLLETATPAATVAADWPSGTNSHSPSDVIQTAPRSMTWNNGNYGY